jgi:PASTA domain-containing protein/IPT/TIG domain-containing protein
LAAPSSAAAVVTLGQVARPGDAVEACNLGRPYDEPMTASAGNSYTVPTGGLVTSWSTNAGRPSGQQLTFKVYRPLGAGVYRVVGHDGPRPLTPSTVNTFRTAIQVQAGDVIGFDVPSYLEVGFESLSACRFASGDPADVLGNAEGNAGDGQSLAIEESVPGERLNLRATLLPPPSIGGIAPVAGSIAGGDSISIVGTDFTDVSAVSFGGVPAQSYSVEAEDRLIAIAPAAAALISVPITVTTPAGTATSAQTFTYQGCTVPRLRGQKLKAAKRRIRAADCRVGTIKKRGTATAKTGKVVRQAPKPGAIYPPGAKIKITLGRPGTR